MTEKQALAFWKERKKQECVLCVLADNCESVGKKCKYLEAVNMAIEALKEPKQGEWIVKNDEMEVFCSVCDKPLPCSDEYDYETNYCPNCGARMRGDEK